MVVCATLRDAADGIALSNIKPAYGFVSMVVVKTIAISAGNPIIVTMGAIATFNQSTAPAISAIFTTIKVGIKTLNKAQDTI